MLYALFSFVLGIVTAIYLSANSQVSKVLGSAVAANVPFFFTALVTSLVLLFLSGQQRSLLELGAVNWPFLLTGVASGFMILGTTILVPHLGARPFFVLLLAGQLIGALLISHHGWFQSPVQPFGLRQLAGTLTMIVGATVALWPS